MGKTYDNRVNAKKFEFLQGPRSVTEFIEDFDFMAMNEKFNKDEVLSHLGIKQ